MTFYHRTTEGAAKQILSSGFQDVYGTYMTRQVHSGVWLSYRPVDINEGAKGGILLEVVIDRTESELDQFEWKYEVHMGYREWLIPSSLVNEGSVRRLSDEDENAVYKRLDTEMVDALSPEDRKDEIAWREAMFKWVDDGIGPKPARPAWRERMICPAPQQGESGEE